MITRNVTVKEDDFGLFVLYKPQFPAEGKGKFFTIRIPRKRNMFDSDEIEPFKAGEKVQVQAFNQNMGWYKVRRKGTREYSLWNGPRLESNGFTVCWVPYDHTI